MIHAIVQEEASRHTDNGLMQLIVLVLAAILICDALLDWLRRR